MSGKWGQLEVPHTGWTCVSVDDLGAPDAVCEMCETQEIRYVHHMEHPDYRESLGVGCICAETMEDDYEAPRLSDVSAFGTNWGNCITEDFWLIVVTEGNED